MTEERKSGRGASNPAASGGPVNGAPRIVRPAGGGAGRADFDRTPLRRDGRRGYGLVGVLRARGWRGWRSDDDEIVKVRHRDVEAVLRPSPFAMPPLRAPLVQDHQREVERIMRRTTILPAPYGVVFSGRASVQTFLRDQYLALDEGLTLVQGHWEIRLHVLYGGPGEASAEDGERAMEIYADLRREARAAIPFPREPGRLLSAAFLVARSSWIDFVERADRSGAEVDGLAIDVTGPWPPYDFVRIVP